MNRIDPNEELRELNQEIAVKQHTTARMMRQTQALVDELNQLRAERDAVAEYIKTHKPKSKCERPECDRDAKAKGLCNSHYASERSAGRLRNV